MLTALATNNAQKNIVLAMTAGARLRWHVLCDTKHDVFNDVLISKAHECSEFQFSPLTRVRTCANAVHDAKQEKWCATLIIGLRRTR
jgi:hypothetical protein